VIPLTSILGALGLGSLIYATLILATLGAKFGEVTKMPPYYRAYYGAVVGLIIALVTHLLRASVVWDPQRAPGWLNHPYTLLLAYYVPLAAGVSISLIVTWRYWSWLLKERLE
jgi:hypothetical protein